MSVRLVSRLLCVLAVVGCSAKGKPEPVWVGQLLPLHGADRDAGRRARQGAELAVDEAHDAGHSADGRVCALLHVDDRGDPETVQAETVRLLTVNKAAALLAGFDAPLTERLLRARRPYGVPVVVPAELVEPADEPGVLSLGVPPAVRGRVLARHASAEHKRPRAAVLTDGRQPVAVAVAAAFLRAWPRDKGGSAEEWTFTTAAERDERLQRLAQAEPSAVLLACSVADFRALRPRLAAALPDVPLLYGGADVGTGPLRAELEAGADVHLATAFAADRLTESGRAFARRFEERFHEPPDLFAAHSYDAARLLLDALARVGPGKDALGKELTGLQEFDGVAGPIRWKDRRPLRRVFVVALKGNREEVLRVVEPDEN